MSRFENYTKISDQSTQLAHDVDAVYKHDVEGKRRVNSLREEILKAE